MLNVEMIRISICWAKIYIIKINFKCDLGLPSLQYSLLSQPLFIFFLNEAIGKFKIIHAAQMLFLLDQTFVLC